MTLRTWAAGSLVAAIALPALANENPGLVFNGEATAPDSDRVTYHEHHQVAGACDNGWWQPHRQDVRYQRPDNDRPFATKTLTYEHRLQMPAVDFRQPSFDEQIRITLEGDTVAIDWSMKGEDGGQWTVNAEPGLVIDAGFDHFIRAHWSELTAGEAVGFQFLAPTRGQAYDFVAEPAANAIGDADHSFRIRPAGLIMRLAVDPIRLGYRDDGLLTHYQGLGNIRRNRDENYPVHIRYQADTMPECSLLPSS